MLDHEGERLGAKREHGLRAWHADERSRAGWHSLGTKHEHGWRAWHADERSRAGCA